jgi:hypothetical protein
MSTRTAQPPGRRLAAIAAAAATAALLAGASPAAAQARPSTGSAGGARAVSGGTWGKAIEVPGTEALNTGGNATVDSVSCASAGTCSAGGGYVDSSGHGQAFVVSQVHGTWGKAKGVPGTAALNTGGFAAVFAVSCATAGNCSAGGQYADSSGNSQVFVVSQAGGTWGKAEEVPGTAALDTGGYAFLNAVSCASPGNCSAGGYYITSAGLEHPFVVSQVHGSWDKAKGVPVGAGPGAYVSSVSCASPGNCSAGGYYDKGTSGPLQAFVISQAGGTWGKAKQVPGTGTGNSIVNSVSCASAGNCTAGGSYTDNTGHSQAFVVAQAGGAWGTAKEVPGTAALNKGGGAGVNSLSCAAAGTCTAGGSYKDSSGHSQAFVVAQAGGAWGTAKEVPGTAALNKGGNAGTGWVSCAAPDTCSAAGSYKDSSGHTQAFVVTQAGRAWGTAEEVPGTAALNTGGGAGINSLSCAPAGTCSAGGQYTDNSGRAQAFVVSQS